MVDRRHERPSKMLKANAGYVIPSNNKGPQYCKNCCNYKGVATNSTENCARVLSIVNAFARCTLFNIPRK